MALSAGAQGEVTKITNVTICVCGFSFLDRRCVCVRRAGDSAFTWASQPGSRPGVHHSPISRKTLLWPQWLLLRSSESSMRSADSS
jgi:hypothetical protein